MKKIAFITDIHFGVRSNSKIFLDNYEKFFKDIFFPCLEENGIDNVINLGDTWEDRRNLSPYTLSRAREMFFDELEKRRISMHMLTGNHDVFHRNSNEVNTVQFVEEMYPLNVHAISEPKIIDIGIPIAMVPWIHRANYDASIEFLEKCACEGVKVVGGHFEFTGFEITKGHVSSHGMDSGIVSRFPCVVSGHFHVSSRQGNIRYIGNPSQTNWGDLGLEKGFQLFNPKTTEFEFVRNPYAMFKELEWGEGGHDPEYFRGVYGRVKIKSFENLKRAELDLFISKAQEISHGIQVVEPDMVLDGVVASAEEIQTTNAIIAAYIEESVGSKKEIDSERLKKIFEELYNEAASKMEIE